MQSTSLFDIQSINEIYKYRPDNSLLYISIAVLIAHSFLILFIILFSNEHIIEKNKRLVVQTVQLQPSVNSVITEKSFTPHIAEIEPELVVNNEINVSELQPIQTIEEEPQLIKESPKQIEPEPIPLPKAEAVKPVIKNEPKPIPKPTPKPVPKKDIKPVSKKIAEVPKKETKIEKSNTKPEEKKPVKKDVKPEITKANLEAEANRKKKLELLAKAQDKIAQVKSGKGTAAPTKSSNSNSVSKEASSTLGALSIDAIGFESQGDITSREISYREELAQRLKLLLKLPEHGEVKLKLTLDRAGKFVKLSIVSSGSKKNQSYIEKTVPSLSFPAFGDRFGSSKDYTFTITLNNDI